MTRTIQYSYQLFQVKRIALVYRLGQGCHILSKPTSKLGRWLAPNDPCCHSWDGHNWRSSNGHNRQNFDADL